MANLDKQHALGTAKESLLYVHYLLYSCQMEFLTQLFSFFFYFIFNKAGREVRKCKRKKKKKNLPVYLLFNSEHEHSLVVGALIWQ